MKTNTKLIALAMGLSSLAGVTIMARPVAVGVRVEMPASPPPVVIEQVPEPAVSVQIGVPEYYIWDGYEYIGVVGNQYYYLGPRHVWMLCDPVRLERFRGWETAHMDWRMHATVNKHYRRDALGHDHPWHNDRSFDRDRDHGHSR